MYEHGSGTSGKRFCIKSLAVIENNAVTAGHITLDRWVFSSSKPTSRKKKEKNRDIVECLSRNVLYLVRLKEQIFLSGPGRQTCVQINRHTQVLKLVSSRLSSMD